MSKLIFFVDDDKLILNLLEYTINNRQGYKVNAFLSGEECLKNMHLQPDIIVLDHIFNSQAPAHMLNGFEILKEIREQRKDLPVIILTGMGDESTASEYLKRGANEYLPKSNYFIDTLIELIDKYI